MSDIIIDVPATYVTPQPSVGDKVIVGVPVPGDQSAFSIPGAAATVDISFAERTVLIPQACALTLSAASPIGINRSTRLLRWFDGAGVVTLAWLAGQTVNGVAGPGSLTFGTGRKSVCILQLSSTAYAVEGNIAS